MKRNFYKLISIGLFLIISILTLTTSIAMAGGWAMVALDSLPVAPRVGEVLHLGFTVRQHAVTPLNVVEPYLVAQNEEAGISIRVNARQEGAVGHFVVDVVFPSPGTWIWGIRPEPFGTIPEYYEPLTVLPAIDTANTTTSTNPQSKVDYGRALFVAKGCSACHTYSGITHSIPGPVIGPDLTNHPADPTFLRQWLHDPASIRPDTRMPNLGLDEAEIEALIDFLTPEPFFIRSEGAKGPLIVYDMAHMQQQFTLPAGMPSADWKYYYTAKAWEDYTFLQAFDPQTGLSEKFFALALDGRWTLSSVSPSGRWIALTRIASDHEKAILKKEGWWQTDIQIVDADKGQVVHSAKLDGNFEIEAISASGDSLFLIQHLPATNPKRYLVRLYDLIAEELQSDALRDKTATDEFMTGLAWGGLASVDGQWLLTLYLNTQRNVAFIHALNLESKFPLCIDLPSGEGDFSQLRHYSLALSADGQRVYAANAALGVVAEVSLNTFDIIRQDNFPASIPTEMTVEYDSTPANFSILSKDGQMLYFSSGWDVWGYDTKSRQVSGPYLSNVQIRGMGLSGDGQRLYVAIEGQSPVAIEIAKEE